MDLELEDKVIVITGSSRGIGKELAKAFSKENCKIVINYLKSEVLAEKLYEELSNNTRCIKVKANIANPYEVKKLMLKTLSTFGRIDVLVNNAGICEDSTIQEMNAVQWKRVIDTNLTGVFWCCKIFSEIMIKQRTGKIINISSLKGQEGSAMQTNYSASKAGIIGFGKALAKELCEYNISVNTVCPGFITTDLNRRNHIKEEIAKKRSLLDYHRNLYDLVNFILFISSDKIKSVSGQVFNVDSRV